VLVFSLDIYENYHVIFVFENIEGIALGHLVVEGGGK
jgi:hypothetical protein